MATATKKSAVKITKGRTAAKATATKKPVAVQASVTIKMDRSPTEPKGKGGVRFDERNPRSAQDKHTFYLSQKKDKALGSPKTGTLLFTAGG